ncbi:MAG: hypothetical protein M9890_02450 [Thermomicrobiales bacterium]|nr:hypothetical protein [Thermomicrobiales bacterium]
MVRFNGLVWRLAMFVAITALIVAAAACSGPDTRDDADPTSTPTETPTATPLPPTATATATPSPSATPEPSPTVTPTVAASPTGNASPTAVSDLEPLLPALANLPDGGAGYIIAEQGTRTAQDLANAYSDPAAHLQRLNTWGFKRHVFRAFARDDESGGLPSTILTTINEYGSPEQAGEAINWLKILATTQGAAEADAPQLGDEAVAVTQPTAEGTATASIYIRQGPVVFVYFGQGGEPLPVLTAIAESVLKP